MQSDSWWGGCWSWWNCWKGELRREAGRSSSTFLPSLALNLLEKAGLCSPSPFVLKQSWQQGPLPCWMASGPRDEPHSCYLEKRKRKKVWVTTGIVGSGWALGGLETDLGLTVNPLRFSTLLVSTYCLPGTWLDCGGTGVNQSRGWQSRPSVVRGLSAKAQLCALLQGAPIEQKAGGVCQSSAKSVSPQSCWRKPRHPGHWVRW